MWLVLKESLMSKGEQELERAEKGKKLNEQGNQDEIDRCRDPQQADWLEDEFDEEFWIKVMRRDELQV